MEQFTEPVEGRTSEGERFQTYRATFTMLEVPRIKRLALRSRSWKCPFRACSSSLAQMGRDRAVSTVYPFGPTDWHLAGLSGLSSYRLQAVDDKAGGLLDLSVAREATKTESDRRVGLFR